jgi:hypothetical protein
VLILLDKNIKDKVKSWARCDVPENTSCLCSGVAFVSVASAFVLLACCFCFWVRASLVVSSGVKYFLFFVSFWGVKVERTSWTIYPTSCKTQLCIFLFVLMFVPGE